MAKYLSDIQWGRVYAAAWQDPGFKEKLEANPADAIRERFPDWQFERLMRVPAAPEDLSEDHIASIAGGENNFLVSGSSSGTC